MSETTTCLADMCEPVAAVTAEQMIPDHQLHHAVPEDMETKISHQDKLKQAQEYLKEADVREKELRGQVEILEAKLQKAEQAIKDMPEDHIQRLQDLNLAQKSVEFYQGIYQNSEARASALQQRIAQLMKKKDMQEAANHRAEKLQKECDKQRNMILRLVNQNSSLQATVDSSRNTHEKAMERKEQQLLRLEARKREAMEFLEEQKKKYEVIERERDDLEEIYEGLFNSVESQNSDATDNFNRLSVRYECLRQLYIAIVSEAKHLRRIFDRGIKLLEDYKPFLQHCTQTTLNNRVNLPETHSIGLAVAMDELEAFDILQGMINSDPDDETRVEFGLGQTAKEFCKLLVHFEEISCSSGSSASRSGTWNLFKRKLSGIKRR